MMFVLPYDLATIYFGGPANVGMKIEAPNGRALVFEHKMYGISFGRMFIGITILGEEK